MELNIKCWYKMNGKYYALNVEGKNIKDCREKLLTFLFKKGIDFNENDYGVIEDLEYIEDIFASKPKETGITLC